MRRTPAPTCTATRSSRRVLPMLATATLTVLALAACGTEKSGVGGVQSNSAASASASASASAKVGPGAAFTQMLGKVAQRCPASAPPKAPPTGPAQALPPGAVAPGDAMEPIAPTAGPEVELNARDWCAANFHEERIAQALWDLADPTPAKVRAILNGLGYIDGRIHGLKQSGTTTRFFLDLREEGGRLCLDGTAAGEETVIDKCVAPATGPFKAGEQKA